MATEQGIRALLVEHLGVSEELIDHLQMIDIALALGEVLGVAFPLYRLRHLMTYRDLLRAARDALNEQMAHDGDFYVRARLRAADVNVVRVGALTQAFATALADDVRHAPAGASLDVAVPDDFSDADLAALRRRLAWLLGATVSLVVRRAGDVGPDISVPWDRMTQGHAQNGGGGPLAQRCGRGITIAFDAEDHPYERRRFPA
ncbi:MAG TPA: hypothetical protein VL049_30730 [Candidatus Dormibacteraeota bacterium]|nr:hypothetical protein [Candidatus Dormibacteraeota bacterium]